MEQMQLIMANKNYSSWSVRPWLLMKHMGIPFEDRVIALGTPQSADEIEKVSPSGRLPVLLDGTTCVWDSLAICEYLSEKFGSTLKNTMWPNDPIWRAKARAMSAEMHSGFAALRNRLPMNIRARIPGLELSCEVQSDIHRISKSWTEALKESGGPFLWGSYSIADAIYAPVILRFRTYMIQPANPTVVKYIQTMIDTPAVRELIVVATKENLSIAKYDNIS